MDEITPRDGGAPSSCSSVFRSSRRALEAERDSATRELAEELVSAIVQLYGEGLERILAVLIGSGGRRGHAWRQD